ncbi:unnamed protein product [Phytophthora fragariaefolia]|uniref:Unnamed protein product n=1 Tax=Phytophthora fragariaefolia TaxID=1490495 RepID=A0A9W6XHF1_9STRA|nr:unnamed protein product [Phytophthora fragariaefolia]
MAGSGSRKKEGRRQLAESEPSRQSRRVANLGIEPHRSLEDVERDARKANAERRKAAKEAKEVSAQEGLGPDDEDKFVPDASAPVSVGGADVVEPPVGGGVSDSPQPEHEVEASDDDEVEYVETKKPQFGPADDVEVVEVGSDPDGDDDEVEPMNVEPAVRKEAHLSTVQEAQVLEDMEVSSLKSSGTAFIRTPVQARSPPVSSAEVQVKVFVADQVRRWERDVSEWSLPPNIKYDWPHDHLDSSSYLSAVLTTSEQLIVRAVEIQVSARAEQPRPDGIVLEPDVEMSDREVELLGRDYVRMLKVSGLQKPRSPRGPSVREPGPKRIQRVPALAPPSSIPTPESPQSVSSSAFRSVEGARLGRMSPGPESSIKSEYQATSSLFGTTGGSDESLTSATSASRTSRDGSSGSSGFGWGRDAGGHMSAVPMAMTARTFGGDASVGPAIVMYVTQETLPSNLVQVDQDDVTMSEYSRSHARGRKSKSSRRRSKRTSPSPSGASEKLEHAPTQTGNARVHRETETQEAARLEAVRLGRERADALLAQYRAQTEAHQAEEARRVTTMVESMQQELENMRVERTRERETAKNVQTFLRKQLRNILTTFVQTTPRPITSQPDLATSRPILSDNSDSDSSSGSSDQDSDHSDSSSFEDVVPNVPTVIGPGGTMFTFRPYVNASALEDFDEKASLAVRTRWLERFQSIAGQGGWTDKVKIYEMKLKLSAAVRNWRANLRPKVRRDWKKFQKEFREMYCKAKTSDSERYYTMMQRKSESPLEFYYHLNQVADKAGIDFDSSSKQRERHLKVFTKKPLDSRLRTTLQGQRIRKLRDQEYRTTFRMAKRSGRAYVIQDEDILDEDDRETRFQDVVEEVPNVPSAVSPAAGSAQPGSDSGKDGSQAQDISSAVFRIIENLLRVGSFDRRPDHPVSQTGIAPSSVNAAMILDILPRAAGPTSSVIAVAARGTLLGCAECDLARSVRSFMKTNVENGKKFQAVKTLARQGTLDLPSAIRGQLLDGDADSGEQQLN